MHFQDLLAADDVRIRHHDLAVEAGPDAAAPDRARRDGWSRRFRITPSLASKPSISTSNWFSVCSRSSLPPPRPAPAVTAQPRRFRR